MQFAGTLKIIGRGAVPSRRFQFRNINDRNPKEGSKMQSNGSTQKIRRAHVRPSATIIETATVLAGNYDRIVGTLRKVSKRVRHDDRAAARFAKAFERGLS